MTTKTNHILDQHTLDLRIYLWLKYNQSNDITDWTTSLWLRYILAFTDSCGPLSITPRTTTRPKSSPPRHQYNGHAYLMRLSNLRLRSVTTKSLLATTGIRIRLRNQCYIVVTNFGTGHLEKTPSRANPLEKVVMAWIVILLNQFEKGVKSISFPSIRT